MRQLNSALQVIEPVRSRCLCVRVGAPTADEIRDVLLAVAKKESLDLPDALAKRIASTSGSTQLSTCMHGDRHN